MKQTHILLTSFKPWRYLLAAAALAALTACGGGGDGQRSDVQPETPPEVQDPLPPDFADQNTEIFEYDSAPARGQLLLAEPLRQTRASEIATALSDLAAVPTPFAPRYAVDSYRLNYLTEDADGHLVEASGLLALPVKHGQTSSPVISYQHATTFLNEEAPSISQDPAEVPLLLASQGYIVVAADYLGFGVDHGHPHPYLKNDVTAFSVMDLLQAADDWRALKHVPDNGQLYLTGYSQGGHATLATQRQMTLEASPRLDDLVLTVAGSGPYDMQATLDGLVRYIRDSGRLSNVIGALLKPGNMSKMPREIRREVHRAIVREITPEDANVQYDTQFIDDYLDDDISILHAEYSVHLGWSPTAPITLFHGLDDLTVPYAASVSAQQSLQQSGGADVRLQNCSHQPSGHIDCVPEYLALTLGLMAQTATGL